MPKEHTVREMVAHRSEKMSPLAKTLAMRASVSIGGGSNTALTQWAEISSCHRASRSSGPIRGSQRLWRTLSITCSSGVEQRLHVQTPVEDLALGEGVEELLEVFDVAGLELVVEREAGQGHFLHQR